MTSAELYSPELTKGVRRWLPSSLSETERNYVFALLLVLGTTAIFGVFYAIEMQVGRWHDDIRFVRTPTETCMRYLGLSHFLVAFIYMSTSRRMRSAKAWLFFAAMLAMGGAFCFAYSQLRTIAPLLGSMLFFGYFLTHDFRDQIFFYSVNRDMPASYDAKSLNVILFGLPFVAGGLLAAVGLTAAAFEAPGTRLLAGFFGAVAPIVRQTTSLLFLIAMIAAAFALRARWNASGLGSFRAFAKANRPIFFVFAGTALLLTIGGAMGASGDAVVILHVVAWYVFTIRQLSKNGKSDAPVRGWAWVRTTTAGFNTLHIATAVLFMIAGAYWAFTLENDPSATPLNLVLSRDYFRYWTILHVSASWGGR